MKVSSSQINHSYSLQAGFSGRKKPALPKKSETMALLKLPYIELPDNPEQAQEDLEVLRNRYLRRPMGNFIDIPV
jgi:hypothetical protein